MVGRLESGPSHHTIGISSRRPPDRCARLWRPTVRMLPAVRTRRVSRVATALVAVWLGSAVQVWANTLKIVPLVRDGQVLVSCHLADAYTSDLREVIQSGLRTTFTYTVELRLKVPMWVDRVVESAVVTTTVQYDNLTRRHSVSRLLDGRVEDARVTDDEAIVREWLTAFDKLPLFRTSRLEPNREYYVVVRAAARPASDVPLWPWGTTASGQTKFTFIP